MFIGGLILELVGATAGSEEMESHIRFDESEIPPATKNT